MASGLSVSPTGSGPDGDDAGVYESDKGFLDRDHHTVARP
jgi:hypothetical protein